MTACGSTIRVGCLVLACLCGALPVFAQTARDGEIASDASAGAAAIPSAGGDLSNLSCPPLIPAEVPVVDGVTLCQAPPAAYPPAAIRQGQQGTVVLRVLVADDGSPVRITIATSSGFPLLDDAARAAARQTFDVERARANGGEGGLLVPVAFVLDDADLINTSTIEKPGWEE